LERYFIAWLRVGCPMPLTGMKENSAVYVWREKKTKSFLRKMDNNSYFNSHDNYSFARLGCRTIYDRWFVAPAFSWLKPRMVLTGRSGRMPIRQILFRFLFLNSAEVVDAERLSAC
jgi:hypothetical protein